jgi:hypothetical protein
MEVDTVQAAVTEPIDTLTPFDEPEPTSTVEVVASLPEGPFIIDEPELDSMPDTPATPIAIPIPTPLMTYQQPKEQL